MTAKLHKPAHGRAETPFGPFLLTWKSWKEYDRPEVKDSLTPPRRVVTMSRDPAVAAF
jgi:hypothetical protein